MTMGPVRVMACRLATAVFMAAIAVSGASASSPGPGDAQGPVGQIEVEFSGDLTGSYKLPMAAVSDNTRIDADGFYVTWSDPAQGVRFAIADLEGEPLVTAVFLRPPILEGSPKATYFAPSDDSNRACDVVIDSLDTGVLRGTVDCAGLESVESVEGSASHPVIDVHARFEARLPGAVAPSVEPPRGPLETIRHSTGAITLKAPSSWGTQDADWTDAGSVIGPVILASADPAAFHDAFVAAERLDKRRWAVPGVTVGVSRQLAQDLGMADGSRFDGIMSLAEWHSNSGPHEDAEAFDIECATRDGASVYSNVDGTLDGFVTRWEGCGPQQAILLDLAALPDDGSYVVSAVAVAPHDDAEFASDVLQSIHVDGSRLP